MAIFLLGFVIPPLVIKLWRRRKWIKTVRDDRTSRARGGFCDRCGQKWDPINLACRHCGGIVISSLPPKVYR